ncbi:MAG: EpsI family protein, partial [Halothiobacillaceae bacterium]
IYLPASMPAGEGMAFQVLSKPYWAMLLLLLISVVAALALPSREELIPARSDFTTFPNTISQWHGQDDRLDPDVIKALRFDDYVMINYLNEAKNAVNFYVAYYASQRKGESAHSPRSCIPGGGWEITSHTKPVLDKMTVNGVPLQINRLVIQKEETTQLVYYWFQQRGRVITNEYLVKWYLFWDAITKNRSDGALVRLTTLVPEGSSVAEGDVTLNRFAEDVVPTLNRYIPD